MNRIELLTRPLGEFQLGSGIASDMQELKLHAGGGKERPERNATPPGTTTSQVGSRQNVD